MDGASRRNEVAGCGGLIRGSNGNWFRGLPINIGWCTAYVTELWEVSEGLKLAWNHEFPKVELCINSKVVVNTLRSTKGV
ncbi:nucleic acid binding protein [Trifolium pratense]|uniref:Nucleic acid binding protein n=1 Tax=Trifolium pratense TaxID=57577 RepID=A0A2K3LYZ2_TRIPR|nr:nucleic acid binding protein [Trifolium pratense]